MNRIVVVLLVCWALPTAAAEKKFALLVGVNKYQHAGLNQPVPLDYAEADVAEFEALLKRSGYETVALLGEKATLEAIRTQLKALQRKGNGASVVLAAFAGHGIQPEGAKEAYYCPYDADQKVFERNGKKDADWDLEGTMLPLSEVLAYLKGSGAEAKAVLVDACRNDPKAARGRGFGTEFNAGDLPENLALLLSCSKGERAFEDREWKHGAFFYHVLKGMREGKGAIEGRVTANSLVAYVSGAVRRDVPAVIKGGARQRPHAIINGDVDFRIEPASSKPVEPEASAEPDQRQAGQVVEVEIAKDTNGQPVKMKFCFCPPSNGRVKLGSPKSERQKVLKEIMQDTESASLKAEAEEVRGEFETKKGFWLGKFPVTQGEWAAMFAGNADPKSRPSYFVPTEETMKKDGITDTSRFPVEQVSHQDCRKLIEKLNEGVKNGSIKLPPAIAKGRFCLPYENEWEYAARGGLGNKRAYYFGDELNGELANCDGNLPFGGLPAGPYLGRTSEVGSYENKEHKELKAKHPWGLCDMAGNVYQWCEDKYANEDAFVVRGASWTNSSGACRSAFRTRYEPDYRHSHLGCRVCFRVD